LLIPRLLEYIETSENTLNAEKTNLWTAEFCLSLKSPKSLGGKFCQGCAPTELWVLEKRKHKAQ